MITPEMIAKADRAINRNKYTYEIAEAVVSAVYDDIRAQALLEAEREVGLLMQEKCDLADVEQPGYEMAIGMAVDAVRSLAGEVTP